MGQELRLWVLVSAQVLTSHVAWPISAFSQSTCKEVVFLGNRCNYTEKLRQQSIYPFHCSRVIREHILVK